jgi:hypothetical protein
MLNNVNFASVSPAVTMKKSVKIIFAVCAVAITGVITLQLFWLKNYISVNKEAFAKEVQASFEQAAKREFTQRGDTVQELFYQYLMDTSHVLITSKKDAKTNRYTYVISDRKDQSDFFIFSSNLINEPITNQLAAEKKIVAEEYARAYRVGEFEKNSLVYNKTNNINSLLAELGQTQLFNVNRLSVEFNVLLGQKGIHEPFVFYFGDTEKMVAKKQLPDSIQEAYPYITYPLPTNKNQKDYSYIIALFKSR